MCSDLIPTVNDAQAARTRVEMGLDILARLLDRYDAHPDVLRALHYTLDGARDLKAHQAELYRELYQRHRAQSTRETE